MISPDTPIGEMIARETDGRGYAVYDVERLRLTVYFPEANEEQRYRLMLKLRDYIDRRGLWNSFEKITIQSLYYT